MPPKQSTGCSNKRPAQQSMQETESRTSNANRVEAVAAECWPSCTPAAHGIERGISDHAVESLTLGMPATDTLQKSSDRRAALRDCRPRRAKCLLRALRLRRLRLAVTHAEKPAAASSNAAGRLFSAGVPGENRTCALALPNGVRAKRRRVQSRDHPTLHPVGPGQG